MKKPTTKPKSCYCRRYETETQMPPLDAIAVHDDCDAKQEAMPDVGLCQDAYGRLTWSNQRRLARRGWREAQMSPE